MDNTPDGQGLSAWLDGELEGAERDAVRAWLRAHPDDDAQVQAWASDRDALRALFDPVLDEPVPEALHQLVQAAELPAPSAGPAASAEAARAWHQRPWAQAALAAGLLLAGGLLGSALSHRQGGTHLAAAGAGASGANPAATDATPLWAQRAATAHAVYVPEVRHPVEVSVREGDPAQQKAQEEHLAKWLTKRLAMPVKLVDLSAQGYSLVGGRLLPDTNKPSAQFMYENAQGKRITLYLRKPENNAEVAFRHQQQGDNGLLYWVDEGYGWALVGAMPREQLLAMAEVVYHQTEALVHATQAAASAAAASGAAAAPPASAPAR
ncbi:putative transmembrane transcriptional regulator (anti-sigma factor) [Burkholderiales bacterium JOSHI_001]|nr:putative transmembrane transcriptional regulator (anti-sigma factor) [Burkholderiales bacterium JOSHI_001]